MKNYKIKTYEVESIPEIIKVIDDIGVSFNCTTENLWYRGMSSDNYKLIPGIYRNIIEMVKEETVIHDFMNSYGIYSNTKYNNDLELYALMQHYGIPTRLLDWTTSPFIASYFALEKMNRNDNEGNRVIWVMNPAALNKITIDEYKMKIFNPNIFDIPKLGKDLNVIAIKPTFSNRRIISQKGQFTFHFNEKPIEDYFKEAKSNEVAKIIISKDEMMASIMKEKLFRLGFKEDDIYQNLDSLSKRIVRENKNVVNKALGLIPKQLLKSIYIDRDIRVDIP